MTSFLTSLYLLSFKQAETAHSLDLDCIKISNKRICTQGFYCDAKSEFFRSRCNDCKQHWGWKKSISSLEKLFKSYKCIFSSWDSNQPLLLLFSNGSIVSIELNNENNTLKKIEIDSNLNGKIIASRIVDAIICENYIFITYCEPKLTLVHINQESPSFSAKILGKKKGKLVGFDPKITHIDLIGPSSKNLERKLSLNSSKDHLLVWWQFSSDLVWPWNPSIYGDRADRMNMLIYSLNEYVKILCTVKVQGELISAMYSKQYSNQIITLEEVRSEKETSVNVSVYEIVGDQCHHIFISKLPLQGKVLAFDWSSTDKLLISDSNSLLLIYDLRKKTSIVTNLSFLPKSLIWHPQDCIVLVTGTSGQVQCFDAALTCVKFKLFYKTDVEYKILELNSHFTQSCCVHKLLWQKSDFNNSCLLWLDSDLSTFVLLKFTFGSISRNNLTALELISQYLKTSSIDEAILLLMSLNWWHSSKLHFRCLSKVTNFLLRKPLNLQIQAGLEMALGTFYNNVELMPKRTYRFYEHKVNHLARRFFHHLLRHHQFRKAFLLAVDLESQDLFLDLSHVAKQKGENVLALVAFHKANELDGSQESTSGSSSCSSSTDVSTASDDRTEKWAALIDPCVMPNENSVVEGSNQQFWSPISEKSTFTNNWLGSSERNSHFIQPFHDKHTMQHLFASPDSCDKLPVCVNQSYVEAPYGTTSRNKLQVIPTLSNLKLSDPYPFFKPAHTENKKKHPYLSNTSSFSGSSSSHEEHLKIIPPLKPETELNFSSSPRTSQSYNQLYSNVDAIHCKTNQPITQKYDNINKQTMDFDDENCKLGRKEKHCVAQVPSNFDDENCKLGRKEKHYVAQAPSNLSYDHQLRIISTFSPKPLPNPPSYSTSTQPYKAESLCNSSHISSNNDSKLSFENMKVSPSLTPKPLPDIPLYSKTSESYASLHLNIDSIKQTAQLAQQRSEMVSRQLLIANKVEGDKLEIKDNHTVTSSSYGPSSYHNLRIISTSHPKPLPDPHLYSRTAESCIKPSLSHSSHTTSLSNINFSHHENVKNVPKLKSRPLPDLSPYSRASGSYEGLCSDINAIHSQSKKEKANKSGNYNIQSRNSNFVEEENDELEDSVIKLSHFGII